MVDQNRDRADGTGTGPDPGSIRGMFSGLPRRIRLTFEYEGIGGFARKALRFLARLTPLRFFLRADTATRRLQRIARSWYRKNWSFVTVIIPSYGDPAPTLRAVRSVRRTTSSRRVRVVVVDDASPPEHRERLARTVRAEVVQGSSNVGFARNVNRALERLALAPQGDVVLLNNDVVVHRGWLESLQYAAHRTPSIGIVTGKLLYPDGTIQFAGSHRNLGALDWFDHRYRFRPGDFGPANVAGPVLSATGACMYVKEDALREVGALDERFEMAFEDVDYCLRAWQTGHRVQYYPAAVLTHAESKTRGRVQREPELRSKDYFWDKWGDWFDVRPVSDAGGSLRIVYVTQDTGVGGGHRVIFEHLHSLADRGHDVSLFTLGREPDWYDLRVPVRSFRKYDDMVAELSQIDAIKVATWWETAEAVWLSSVRSGVPVYFVQDIETSYYPDAREARDRVMASYRPEFRYLTTSPWNRDRLSELGFTATEVPPGVDRATYRPLGRDRRDDVLLAVGRSHHLKNLDLTVAAWRSLPGPRPELWLFGVEPELGRRYGARYVTRPSDEQVNELLNEATAFVQTSRHEGFCLPLLEAMSAGTPTVCTDAHGNRGFCRDGVNTLMVDEEPQAVAAAFTRLLGSPGLRDSLAAEGLETAVRHDWSRQADALEAFFRSVSSRPPGGAEAEQPAEGSAKSH